MCIKTLPGFIIRQVNIFDIDDSHISMPISGASLTTYTMEKGFKYRISCCKTDPSAVVTVQETTDNIRIIYDVTSENQLIEAYSNTEALLLEVEGKDRQVVDINYYQGYISAIGEIVNDYATRVYTDVIDAINTSITIHTYNDIIIRTWDSYDSSLAHVEHS